MRARAAGALILVFASAEAAAAAAGSPGALGTLEKEALGEALASGGFVVDPQPEGKVIGAVHVVTLEVFSPRDRPLSWFTFEWFNIFHRTSREYLVRREALFAPGDRYDPELVEETIRNLSVSSLSNVVVVVPVRNPTPGITDVLIVTRDVWSLRFNSDFEFQQGQLLYLSASLSENNLFGYRKRASLVFGMDQGSMQLGPSYFDPNIAGTRLTLSASARALFSRDGGAPEGSSSRLVVSYPLFSLASPWGASFDIGHSNYVARSFLGDRLRPVDFPDTPEKERWPWIYRVERFGTSAGVVRSYGKRVIQRVSAGHQYGVVRPSFTRDFPDDDEARERVRKQIFPPEERVSAVYLGYSVFTPRYRLYRDLGTFDLREDARLGPTAEAGLSQATWALGSDRDFTSLSAGLGWAWDWGGGLESASLGWSGRVLGGQLIDQTYSARVYAASPVIGGALRVLGNAGATVLIDDTQNRLYSLGGDNGLRGFIIGDLIGKTQAIAHLEVRSLAVSVGSFRLGALAFYDVGGADSPEIDGGADLARAVRSVLALRFHHDVGGGLRLLIPQFNTYVLRLDWAFPLDSTTHTPAGWPGRFSLGFGQVF